LLAKIAAELTEVNEMARLSWSEGELTPEVPTAVVVGVPVEGRLAATLKDGLIPADWIGTLTWRAPGMVGVAMVLGTRRSSRPTRVGRNVRCGLMVSSPRIDGGYRRPGVR
jgi:hypothetical protein